MNKKVKITLYCVIAVIVLGTIIHLGNNWLIPMVIKMHQRTGF